MFWTVLKRLKKEGGIKENKMDTKVVSGFLEIEKSRRENEAFYRRKVATLLYALQASYKGISREIYFSLPEWHPLRVSMLEEEPSGETSEDDMLFDYDTRDKFINHHSAHGWNKELNLDILIEHHPEMLVDEQTYLDEGDFVHWVRRTDAGQIKHLDVYLLKYFEHPKLSEEGIMDFNGLLFAEKDGEEVYKKIKNVLTRFASLLKDKRILHSATIERPSMKEVLAYTADSQPVWVKCREFQ